MQMEALDAVHRESRRLPPIQKVSVALFLAARTLETRHTLTCPLREKQPPGDEELQISLHDVTLVYCMLNEVRYE